MPIGGSRDVPIIFQFILFIFMQFSAKILDLPNNRLAPPSPMGIPGSTTDAQHQDIKLHKNDCRVWIQGG